MGKQWQPTGELKSYPMRALFRKNATFQRNSYCSLCCILTFPVVMVLFVLLIEVCGMRGGCVGVGWACEGHWEVRGRVWPVCRGEEEGGGVVWEVDVFPFGDGCARASATRALVLP